MYCPKCGHQQTSDTFRFCSRCGFQLGFLKELIATGDTSSEGESQPQSRLPQLRQADVNIGAGVMLVGTMKSVIAASVAGGPVGESIIWGLLVLSAGFAIILLLSQLSPRQRGLTLGATLMFVGSLVAFVATGPLGPAGVAMVAAILIPLILFWCRLSRAFMSEFFDQKPSPSKGQMRPPDDKPVLIEARPLQDLYAPPGKASDTESDLKASPASVTEQTTELLSK
ncbi:MAG TPA: zinc ribbon domain-containing protein [Blastocatellia bacterium]|nr:zinc ribbon domain-containing protein [Blastocatellia bacterium]